jgi:hypothetical protein
MNTTVTMCAGDLVLRPGYSSHVAAAPAYLERGGKRSATPLSPGRETFDSSWPFGARESAVAAALCRRTPKKLAPCHFPSKNVRTNDSIEE